MAIEPIRFPAVSGPTRRAGPLRRALDALPADTTRLHAVMLNDRARTGGYVEAVKSVVQPGDVVVDIGTGTGVLALAAAQAGAERVYAIEAGRIARWARRLFEANGFADVIEPVRGWSRAVVLPERADVLVSELIGDEPLAEEVVEITRDAALRLLKPGARLVPDAVSLRASALEIPERALGTMTFTDAQVERWRSWYGIDFGPLADVPEVRLMRHFVNPTDVGSWRALARPVELERVELGAWRAPWVSAGAEFTAERAGELNGVALHFELSTGSLTFVSTDPHQVGKDNHWESPVQILDEPLRVQPGDRVAIAYWYDWRRSQSGCTVRTVT